MGKFIVKMVVAARGFPHEKHVLNTVETRNLTHNGQYIDLTFPDIVDQLFIEFPYLDDVSDKRHVSDKLLYSRVWWWCKQNNIAYRVPNKIAKKNEPLIDRRCLGTLMEVEKVVKEDGLSLEDHANVDETGLRPLLIHLRTLDFKGAKDVPIQSELTSHIMLTLLVIWFGNGEIDFVAVLKSTNGKTFWERFSEVWFLRAVGSKMTSKQTYTELLEVLLQGKSVRLLTGDIHGGHGGTNPDNSLLQRNPPCKRRRIQGGCTADLATADQVQSNKELKARLRKKLRKKHFKTALKGEKIAFEGTLTKKGCEALGQMLTELKNEWNSSKKLKNGVKKAFLQTIHPGTQEEWDALHENEEEKSSPKKTKRLQKRLDNCKKNNWTPVYNPFSSDPNATESCELCGHTYTTEKQRKAHEADPNNCWGRRATLKPPHFAVQNPNDPPRGMLMTVNGHLATIVDHDTAFLLSTQERLPNYFWKQGLPIRYFPHDSKLYIEHQKAIQEALQLHDMREQLQPPLAPDCNMFLMGTKMNFLHRDEAWELPQTRGRNKATKLTGKFWQAKSLKFLDKDSHKAVYRIKKIIISLLKRKLILTFFFRKL